MAKNVPLLTNASVFHGALRWSCWAETLWSWQLQDESLEDADNLPAPEVIAREIVEDLTAALVEFEAVAAALEASSADS